MSTVTERVAAGAAFLDEHDPQWWRADVERAIDLADFDLESTDLCVLGQRCPTATLFDAPDWAHSRYDAMALKFGTFTDRDDVNEWAKPLGFQAQDCDDECDGNCLMCDDYAALTAEWKRVITGRRRAS